ncbi:MAG: restriction endonuclease [Acidobacteriota bacterium]|nr:restriction endonuclease [Acidobacteriota bacterium]
MDRRYRSGDQPLGSGPRPATEAQQFEQLVARIEAAAAPRGAVVKSPDRIRDLTTGRLREVDASIRYKVGTVDVLITVECRKRSRKADDTWIEQLATKRAKLGAAKTIAVSARGFSSSAPQTAAHHGIELRTLSEVSAAEIEDWFLPGVVNVFRVFDKVECGVFLFDPEGQPEQAGYPVDAFAPVFFSDFIHSPFPAATLLHLLERIRPEEFTEVPLDGTKKQIVTGITWEPGQLKAATSSGRRDVAFVGFLVIVYYESRVCELTSGTHHSYSGSDGTEVQHSTFEAEIFDGVATFEFQSTDEGKPAGVGWSFRPKTPAAEASDKPSSEAPTSQGDEADGEGR